MQLGSVTVHVQVVADVTYGNPSPGTLGPTTSISAELVPSWARTVSPWDVTAGLPAIPVSMASGWLVSFGRKDGRDPYESSPLASTLEAGGDSADECEQLDKAGADKTASRQKSAGLSVAWPAAWDRRRAGGPAPVDIPIIAP